MVRKQGWELRLSRFLRQYRAMPFEWGKNDCMMFVACAVQNITGVDPAEAWRGSYSTEINAQQLINSAGGFVELVSAAMGFSPHDKILLAKRGDVVCMELEGGITLGVVDDTGAQIASVSPSGAIRLPLNKANLVWSY